VLSITAKNVSEVHIGKKTRHTDQKKIDFRSPLITKCSKIFPALLGRRERDLLEDMGGRRLRRRKHQLQMIDDPIHNGILRDESDNLHRPPTLGAGHRSTSKTFRIMAAQPLEGMRRSAEGLRLGFLREA